MDEPPAMDDSLRIKLVATLVSWPELSMRDKAEGVLQRAERSLLPSAAARTLPIQKNLLMDVLMLESLVEKWQHARKDGKLHPCLNQHLVAYWFRELQGTFIVELAARLGSQKEGIIRETISAYLSKSGDHRALARVLLHIAGWKLLRDDAGAIKGWL